MTKSSGVAALLSNVDATLHAFPTGTPPHATLRHGGLRMGKPYVGAMDMAVF